MSFLEPRGSQYGPRGPQEAPDTVQECPESVPRCPRWLKTARSLPKPPKTPYEGFKKQERVAGGRSRRPECNISSVPNHTQ
eukprot:7812751-Pyramimonas_sp.AAC.1